MLLDTLRPLALGRSFFIVVVTGGPCAGKTTALARIHAWCLEHGFFPVFVQEAATLLINSGLNPGTPLFQRYILRETLAMLKLRLEAAHHEAGDRQVVLVSDRGLSDGLAYCKNQAEFDTHLRAEGLTRADVLFYPHGVICLQSAAIGAEKHYTRENNSARRESLEEARELDHRTHQAWLGTNHLAYIENLPGGTFHQKLIGCEQALARILGVPKPFEYERKFVLHDCPLPLLQEHAVGVCIRQTYLRGGPDHTFERVRERGIDGHSYYYHTIKTPHQGGSIEHERIISLTEYKQLLKGRGRRRREITKTRYCFVHQGHYVEVDVFKGRHDGLVMAEIELPGPEAPYSFPDWLGPHTQVTGDFRFSNSSIAKSDWKIPALTH